MTVQTHQLPNGFRIVTENMPGLASASVGIWVNAGGRHEALAQNGIAHFMEHMAFKGTASRSALQIAEAIEDVGGYINAYTSREMTAFYARVLKEDVSLAVDVISDILLNPSFDPREIEVERNVILQEIGQANDTPDDIIFDWLQEVSYPDQPIGRSILGPAARVQGFTREDFTGFVQQCYGPGQMILAAAGAVDHDRIVRMAEDLWGSVPARPAPQMTGARFQGGERREIKSLEQAHFTLALETPGYRHDDVYAAQIYASILGGGMSSRLFQQAREKRGLCYSIFAQAGAFEDSGMLTIYAGTSGEQIGELAGVTIDELRRTTDSMTTAEIDRARVQMKAGLLMGLESPSSRCERLARVTAIWDRVPPLSETIEKIDAVSAERLRGFAERLCSDGDPAMALYGPVKTAPDLGTLQRRLAA